MRNRVIGIVVALMGAIGEQAVGQTIYVDVENDAVRKYLDDVWYDRDSESEIYNYVDGNVRQDMPNPAVINVPESAGDIVTVSIGERVDLADCTTQQMAVEDGCVKIYNLTPHCKYYYKAEGEGWKAEGEINVTGRVRMVSFPSVRNMRDMGGWPCGDEYVIKYGKIYRGAELNGDNVATEADIEGLLQIGIGAEIDLREKDENDGAGISAFGFSGDDNTYLFTDNSGCCERGHLTGYVWTQRYRKEFEFIVANLREGRAVYHHCVKGADRTGLLALLMEGLLGVSYEDMVKDYELTSFYKLRTKKNIDFVFDYIESLTGETLQDKFKYYFTNRLYVSLADINYFTQEMLEKKVVVGIEEHVAPQGGIRPSTVYDLNGQPSQEDGKGVRIVVGSDGGSRKVLVK